LIISKLDHMFMKSLLMGVISANVIPNLDDVNGIVIEGGGMRSVFKYWPYIWKMLHMKQLSLAEFLNDKTIGTCSGGGWLMNAMLHDHDVRGAFENCHDEDCFMDHIEGHWRTLKKFTEEANLEEKGYSGNRLCMKPLIFSLKGTLEGALGIDLSVQVMRHTFAKMLYMEDPWTYLNEQITSNFTYTTPEIEFTWVVASAILRESSRHGQKYWLYGTQDSFVPLVQEWTQSSEEKVMKAHILRERDDIQYQSKLRNREHLPLRTIENAVDRSILMTNPRHMCTGSTNFLSMAAGISVLHNAPNCGKPVEWLMQQWPTKIPMTDVGPNEYISLGDCGVWDDLGIVGVVRKFSAETDGQMKTILVLIVSHMSKWNAYFENGIEGKQIFRGVGWENNSRNEWNLLGSSGSIQMYERVVTTIERNDYGIPANRTYLIRSIFISQPVNQLIATERDLEMVKQAANNIFADMNENVRF